jgi:4-hydroxyphenylpyruvate dioxygenase-like putative hemolysin
MIIQQEDSEAYVLDLKLDHIGVHCQDAKEALYAVDFFERFFGLEKNPDRENESSTWTGNQIEWMKEAPNDSVAHFALATSDLMKARQHFESLGFEFDAESLKYSSDGKPLVIYAKQTIAGFSWQLIQR